MAENIRQAYPRASRILGRAARSQGGEELALYEQFFKGTRNGSFVEMGALDGLHFSNTAAFERVLGWRGVLIEANPTVCPALWANRPLATCLCTAVSGDYSGIQMEKGTNTATFGEVAQMDERFKSETHRYVGRFKQYTVPSAPLGHLLRMVGVSQIDLFSLDVEGAEYKVLQTFDWTIPVRVWCIEVKSSNRSEQIGALMRGHGYVRREWATKAAHARAVLADNELWVWGNETELVRGFGVGRFRWSMYEPSRLGRKNAVS